MKLTRVKMSFALIVSIVCVIASDPAFAQQAKVLLEDKKVLVTSVELNAASAFTLPSDQPGTVWITLNSVTLSKGKDGAQRTRLVRAGYAAFTRSKEQVALLHGTTTGGRLIIVEPKKPTQALTVLPFLTSDSEEDASDRGATLLVAASDCRFRYTRSVGDEYAISSQRKIVTLGAGEVIWIPPGMYSFKKLGSKPAKVISIEF